MLTPEQVVKIAGDLWSRHRSELPDMDRVYDYARGARGVPETPGGANDELQRIAKLSVKNVLSLVEDSFTQSLSVVGFRTSDETDDAPAWALWQKQRMDARQQEVHRPAIRYGASYVVVEKSGEDVTFRPRSPRQLFAAYRDPQVDEWPIYAIETWLDQTDATALRRGLLFDATHAYPVTLGSVPHYGTGEVPISIAAQSSVRIDEDQKPRPHGGEGKCPVVRFVNDRDSEDLVRGEIAPLITDQRAINEVNYDRLVVARYGAHAQKYIIGFAAESARQLVEMSAQKLLAFEDDAQQVKVGTFDVSPVEPYNAILLEQMEHVANRAQIPTRDVTGKMANLSAEAIAAADAMQQRKLRGKRESFGESWEQVLRIGAEMVGVEFDATAEVLWQATEIQSYQAIVDGITKLAASGLNIVDLIDDIPSWSEQRKQAAKDRVTEGADVLGAFDRLEALGAGVNRGGVGGDEPPGV